MEIYSTQYAPQNVAQRREYQLSALTVCCLEEIVFETNNEIFMFIFPIKKFIFETSKEI